MSAHTLYALNLQALAEGSPAAAALVRDAAPDDLSIVTAQSGAPVLEQGGRALDSRRDPEAEAERLAVRWAAQRVVLAGLGTGYLAEALLRSTILTEIVVDRPGLLAAAMRARDLREILSRVPVTFPALLRHPADLALLRARADAIVSHGPSVAASPDLRALVATWPTMRVARRLPRVLVVGPVYGGSLEVARSTANAFDAAGADTRLFDASEYASGYHALGALPVASAARMTLQNALADVVGDAVARLAAEWKPDLVFALAQAPLGPAALGALRDLGTTTAFWFVENARVLRYWPQVAPHYDFFYAIQRGRFLEQLADAGARAPAYLPLACDPERHVPVGLSDAERARFGADVSFAGAPYLNRRRLFASLGDVGLRLWGAGWSDPALAPLAAEGGRTFTLDEMIRIFAATRINLNVHSAEHVDGLDPQPDYVNPRTFELAACRAFQIVDRREPLAELFDDEQVVSFSDVAELRALIRRYLADGSAREAVAIRAQSRALAEHTYRHRVTTVLRQTIAPELAAAALAGNQAESLDTALARLERASSEMSDEEATLRIVREVAAGWSLR